MNQFELIKCFNWIDPACSDIIRAYTVPVQWARGAVRSCVLMHWALWKAHRDLYRRPLLPHTALWRPLWQSSTQPRGHMFSVIRNGCRNKHTHFIYLNPPIKLCKYEIQIFQWLNVVLGHPRIHSASTPPQGLGRTQHTHNFPLKHHDTSMLSNICKNQHGFKDT